MRKATSRQSLAQGHVCLAGHAGFLTATGQTEGRVGNLSPVTVEFMKENAVGLGNIPFPSRNTDFISSYGFLGDGLDCCVCGIITRVSLFIYFLTGVQ